MQLYQHISIKGKIVVCAVTERWHDHDLEHMNKCTGVPREMLFAKGSSGFFKTSILERLLLGTDLQVKFHR